MKTYYCKHCGQPLDKTTMVIKQYYNHRMVLVEYFCTTAHFHEWYINRLRSFGL